MVTRTFVPSLNVNGFCAHQLYHRSILNIQLLQMCYVLELKLWGVANNTTQQYVR